MKTKLAILVFLIAATVRAETYTYEVFIAPSGNVIIIRSDGANIPSDKGNRDYREYLKWVKAGNKPKNYDPDKSPAERRKDKK